jgi:hypothetical protein
LELVGEVDQSTLVQAESVHARKMDVGLKLRAAVEVEDEVVAVGGEVDMLEVVELEVEEGEKNGFVEEECFVKDLQKAWEKCVVVIVDTEASVEEESRLAVEVKLTEGLSTPTLTPVGVTPMCSEEAGEQVNFLTPANHVKDGDEEQPQSIDIVDGAAVSRYSMPTHSPSYPKVLSSPASSLPITYCPCCPGMELVWDELSMVDDVLAEYRCHSLPYELDERHFQVAARDDLDDLADEGVDLRMWGGECVVIDADDEEDEGEGEEVEKLLRDGTYDEEDAVWIEDSGVEDGDEDEEAEVEEELLAELFDNSILSIDDDNAAAEPPNGADDSFDLSMALLDFYTPDGSKDELLVNVEPPDFDLADVPDVYEDFDLVLEDPFVSKRVLPGLYEDGLPFSIPAQDGVLPGTAVDLVEYEVPTPDFAVEPPSGADDTFDLTETLLNFYGPLTDPRLNFLSTWFLPISRRRISCVFSMISTLSLGILSFPNGVRVHLVSSKMAGCFVPHPPLSPLRVRLHL